jgi:DNA-binding transcriptional regulator LsrR (DeoR family)
VPGPAIIDATQAEVADIANLSRSVVSRFLQELDREGLVRLGRATIEIPEPQRLLANIERSG